MFTMWSYDYTRVVCHKEDNKLRPQGFVNMCDAYFGRRTNAIVLKRELQLDLF